MRQLLETSKMETKNMEKLTRNRVIKLPERKEELIDSVFCL